MLQFEKKKLDLRSEPTFGNRRRFFKGICQCALVALSIRLTACGSDESLSRISVTSNPNSEDTSNQLPQDSYEDNLETSTQPDETIDSNKDEQISEEPQTTTLLLTDIYAMSLYYDGTMGPQTGVITVDDMVLAQDKTYEFWHGHGGRSHSYVVTAEDFKKIRSGIKVTIETDAVDSHTHTLFIDLTDKEFLVPGTTREVEVENV